VLENYYFRNKTMFDILESSIIGGDMGKGANVLDGKQYIIRDEGGALALRELLELRKPIILGDSSYITSYTYETSIENSFNVVKAIRDNPEIGMKESWQVQDGRNMNRWGHLQLTVEADKHLTESEIVNWISLLLEVKNRPHRKLSASAIGIPGVRDGTGIMVRIDHINTDHWIWCHSVKHQYLANSHTMNIELVV